MTFGAEACLEGVPVRAPAPGRLTGEVGTTGRTVRRRVQEESTMGIGDKITNKAEELVGKAKESVGEHRGDEELKAEGRAQQGEAGLKQAGEDVKDAFRK